MPNSKKPNKLPPKKEEKANLKDGKKSQEEENIQNAEIIDNLPPEIKKVVEMGFSMQRFSGPMPNPFVSKLTEKHIDKILDLGIKEEDNSFVNVKLERRYNLVYFFGAVALFVFLTVFLVDNNKDLFLEILKISVVLLGGFGGGYGYKAYFDKKKNN